MIYQLSDGRCVEMSLEDYLTFTDDELLSLIGYNFGDYLESPFYGSVIKHSSKITTYDCDLDYKEDNQD